MRHTIVIDLRRQLSPNPKRGRPSQPVAVRAGRLARLVPTGVTVLLPNPGTGHRLTFPPPDRRIAHPPAVTMVVKYVGVFPGASLVLLVYVGPGRRRGRVVHSGTAQGALGFSVAALRLAVSSSFPAVPFISGGSSAVVWGPGRLSHELVMLPVCSTGRPSGLVSVAAGGVPMEVCHSGLGLLRPSGAAAFQDDYERALAADPKSGTRPVRRHWCGGSLWCYRPGGALLRPYPDVASHWAHARPRALPVAFGFHSVLT